jgi:hypothetical protein
MKRLITATFKTRKAAEHAMERISQLNITPEQISMIVTDDTRGNSFNIETHSKMDKGAAWGGIIGGVVGGVSGAILLSAGSVIVPMFETVLMGSVISVLTGIGAGASIGALFGAFAGAGVTEYEATIYEGRDKTGGVLIAVEAENDNQQKALKDILEKEDCYSVVA